MRRSDREIKDGKKIAEIIDNCRVLHLAMLDDFAPYILPLSFGYETVNSEYVFYIHCAKEGKKLDLISKNPNVGFELDTGVELTSLDKDNPCTYGCNYQSVVGKGRAEIVEDADEKCHALKLIMLHNVNRDFDFSKEQAECVAIIKVMSNDLRAKARDLKLI